ncbi:MAG: hypothetical protein H3C43_02005 [Leptonema sp. (in: Bacteria)]|nr:hypothetical protein [Leptonema sp. (in: bacteria)]
MAKSSFWIRFSFVCLLALIISVALFADSEPIDLPPMPKPSIIQYSGQSIIQSYRILDKRFCSLTPDRFLCEKCIENDMIFVRLLRFDSEGRPSRYYGCMPWQRPYLN